MRKLNGMAKRSIGIFTAVTVLSAGIVVGSVIKVIASQEESYPVAAGDFVFDNTGSCLEAERDGTIRRSWNSEYELESGGDRYVLGKKTVGYSPGDNQVKVYGGGYLLKEDGMVTTLGRLYRTENMQETRFIKLDDNKFVICGDNIASDDGNLETEKFLYVALDKAGNARLMNHLVNVKVLGETALSTGNLKLNLADKTLDFAGNLLELDEVTGYIGEGGEVYDLFIRGGSGGRGGKGGIGGTGGMGGTGGDGGMGGSGGIGGMGGDGGMGGIGGIGGKGGIGGAGGTGGLGGMGGTASGGGSVTPEMIEMLTDMYIRRADEATNALVCRFNIYDPFNYMGAGQFFIWKTADNINIDQITQADLSSGKVVSMAANASDTELTFGNLKSNTDYTVVMGFIDKEGKFTERDRLTARTRKYDASVRVSEFREDSFKYVVKLDPGMEDIQSVVIKCNNDTLASYTVDSNKKLPSQIETMMTDEGYEGIRKFEGTEANDLVNNSAYATLNLSVTVTFQNSKSDTVETKLDVLNPFYGQNSGASAISELQEEIKSLREEQAALKSMQSGAQNNSGSQSSNSDGSSNNSKNNGSGSNNSGSSDSSGNSSNGGGSNGSGGSGSGSSGGSGSGSNGESGGSGSGSNGGSGSSGTGSNGGSGSSGTGSNGGSGSNGSGSNGGSDSGSSDTGGSAGTGSGSTETDADSGEKKADE